MKSIINWSTNVALGLSLIFCIMACEAGQSKSQKQSGVKEPAAVPSAAASVNNDTTKAPVIANSKIMVYYFHGNARCPTCYKLENYAQSEVESDFADAIKKGTLKWKTVNVEEPGNEHFNNDYRLYTKSVIISVIDNGKESSWKNLDKIWQLVHEEGKYREYIKNEVKACLEGKCL
jgi:hypothetical protein